ncbi:hypothetical protein CPB85DRAFT_1364589 [Mucidula mucida]|nr:hypothetical protein CPB85DRAFT_1364589 [Mucidula mucida]
MSSYISLRDISTKPAFDEPETYEFVNNTDLLDEIEYCLGLERGGIIEYSDLLRAELRSDMVELLKEGQWALIPSRQDLQIMRDLFLDNHAKGTHNRTKFTDAIPIKPFYEYRFMGVEQPGKSFHARSESYESPYSDFPVIRTTLHPCFVFPSLAHCVARGSLSGMKHLTLLGDDVILVYYADHALNMFVYLSFLGKTLAVHFPARRIPSVIVDRPRVESQLRTDTVAIPESGAASERVRIQSPSTSSEFPRSAKTSAKIHTSRSKRTKVSIKKQTGAPVTRKSTSGRKRTTPQISFSVDDGPPTQRRRSPRFIS